MNRLQKQLVAALTTGRVPEPGRLLWGWFCDLSATRTYHMAGPNPISHVEIAAYARLHRIPIEPRHIEVICAMDRAWMQRAFVQAGVTFESGPVPKLTAELFDAVF